MIEVYIRPDGDSEPVLIGHANCSRAVPKMLTALADKWSQELELRDILAASGVPYAEPDPRSGYVVLPM